MIYDTYVYFDTYIILFYYIHFSYDSFAHISGVQLLLGVDSAVDYAIRSVQRRVKLSQLHELTRHWPIAPQLTRNLDPITIRLGLNLSAVRWFSCSQHFRHEHCSTFFLSRSHFWLFWHVCVQRWVKMWTAFQLSLLRAVQPFDQLAFVSISEWFYWSATSHINGSFL